MYLQWVLFRKTKTVYYFEGILPIIQRMILSEGSWNVFSTYVMTHHRKWHSMIQECSLFTYFVNNTIEFAWLILCWSFVVLDLFLDESGIRLIF